MKSGLLVGAGLALVLLAGTALADPVKSGPQVGEKLAGPFHPLNINGEAAGKKNCLYCSNGINPVAMIFARAKTQPGTLSTTQGARVAELEIDTGGWVVSGSRTAQVEIKE